jgi:two-component system, cell cycle sensor histidine kinase and response regulator CckA
MDTDALKHEFFFLHSLDLLAVVGADGYFKLVNPAFETVLGYSEAEMYAKPVVEFLHPDDVNKTRRGIATLAGGSPTIASKNRYLCKGGEYKWMSWNTAPIGPNFYTIGRDITDQMNSEEQIHRLNQELTSQNEDLERAIQQGIAELKQTETQVQQLQKMDAVGRLAGGIAHDFNNMLAVVILSCELLAEDHKDPDAVLNHIHSIKEVTERAAALTRQLLVFSRKQVTQMEAVDLNALITQLEKMLNRLIGENIKIVLKLAPTAAYVSGDPSQMEQVIMNLVVNARDAMPNGGSISIETSKVYLDEMFASKHVAIGKGHYVLLTVTDEGTGMDAETVSKIFDPFFTTKPAGKGTGLGLTTTYGIVKQSNGGIWVYSEPGRGTVFNIYLPVVEKIAEDEKATALSSTTIVQGAAILVVEDNTNLRNAFTTMIRKRGYEVLVAENGTEALAILEAQQNKIDLLLTDIIMPDFSGFELAKRAAPLRPSLPVLYMSGYTSDALESAGMERVENFEFIQKPFGIDALITKIAGILEARA